MRVTKYITFIFLLWFAEYLKGQNVMTSSPYSMFGIGELVTGSNGANAGMGNVAIGMRGTKLINMDNPAGLSGVDSCRLLADVYVFAKWENYYSGGDKNDAFTGNFSGMSLAGRMVPRWYAGVGLSPYSVVGYYFQTKEELEGSPGDYYTSTFQGNGGFSKIHLTNAFLPFPFLSVGVNIGYVFGNMKNIETQSSMEISEEMSGQAWSFDLGVQYMRRLSEELEWVLGATYSFSTEMKLAKERTLTDSYSEQSLQKSNVRMRLPQKIGIGTSLTCKKMTYALDYQFNQYENLHSDDNRVVFRNSHEWRAGFCYHPNGFSSAPIWKRMEYKLGAGISTSYYLNLQDKSGWTWRATVGLGFPVWNGQLNVSAYYDRVSYSPAAINQHVAGVILSLTLSELFHHVKL